jgi:sirohydrochlorin cobaltochelatase
VDSNALKSVVLLVGHGTCDADGQTEFLDLAQQVADLLAAIPLFPCFLELAEPTIDAAVAAAVAGGACRIVIAPMLLFSAGHAQRDIPAAVEAAVARHASGRAIDVRQTDVLGCRPALIELSAVRFREALAQLEAAPTLVDNTCLVLVGRGSFDAAATAEMHRFTARRTELTPVACAETAFIAMAQPRYRDVLQAMADRCQAGTANYRRIVVQPHLLFQGELLQQLYADVAAMAARYPNIAWTTTQHLGAGPGLAPIVSSIIAEQLS